MLITQENLLMNKETIPPSDRNPIRENYFIESLVVFFEYECSWTRLPKKEKGRVHSIGLSLEALFRTFETVGQTARHADRHFDRQKLERN